MVTDTTSVAGGVRVESLEHGTVLALTLATPKANVIDGPKIGALRNALARAAAEPRIKAVLIEGEGAHFSFGASVAEHLPACCEGMLSRFHALLLELLDSNVVCLAVVRGQCLGGGLELASLCHRVFAAPDAKFGQPEISLGVVAPAASIVLPERIGRAAADDLLITGRSVAADEALRIGLVDQVADDPRAAALEYVRRHLASKSASSLRFAVHAARTSFVERFRREIVEHEHMYLCELMVTADAVEGLTAFLEKRPPHWSDA
jgi:cyclohexa-1,5-dienecarbonyl-CoA hydratase